MNERLHFRLPVACFFRRAFLVGAFLFGITTAGLSGQSVKAPGKYHGYGAAATGGEGYPTVIVKTYEELKNALVKGNVTIVIEAAEIHIPDRIQTTASNITLDGQGATLRGDKLPRIQQMLKFVGGRNYIVKNVRLRNGGDNIAFYQGARDIVVDHISSTGAGDDGISISKNSRNATLTHCFLAGNTRAIFIKYGETTNVTVDHCIIMKLCMRAPLVDNIRAFDVRNNLISEWRFQGTRISGKDCNGNVMGNLYVAPPDSPEAKKSSPWVFRSKEVGKIHIADNVLRGCTAVNKSTVDAPLVTPPIDPPYTSDVTAVEQSLLSDTTGAGCMPRDAVDKAYFTVKGLPTHSSAIRIPAGL